MGNLIPPVLLEIKSKAGEASAEVRKEAQAMIAELKKAQAEAEQIAVKAEANAKKLQARADELAAKAATETGEAAAKTSAAAEEAAGQAAKAAEAATVARAKADEAAAKVRSATAGTEASLAQLNRVAKAAFVGTAAAAAVVGYEGVKMAGNFQQAITLLQTGAGELHQNLGLVSSGILGMAGQVGTSAEEIAKHMYTVESAGYHGADGLKVLQAAEEGAKTDGADAAVVADALTTVMKDMHAPASQAADIMSKMVTAVGQGKMRMDDFAGSIHSVLPNAAALHIEFSQVAGALATMTAQGMSADQSAQNLNHTIVKLAAPTTAMTTAMASYGLSAQDVMQHLGERGLTGTMDLLVNAIMNKMGPAGLTLRSAFNQSKAAADDANRMMQNLPASAQKLAQEFLNGQLSMGAFTKAVKDLDPVDANLLKQWVAMQNRAHGFSDALKSGGQDAQTFTGALKSMLGDQTGLQVALHLTGKATADFNNSVKAISESTAQADGHVKDWAEVQHNWNQVLDKAKYGLQAFVIMIGQALIPILTAALGFFEKHTTVAKILGVVILGLVAGLATYGAALFAIEARTKAVAIATDIWKASMLIATRAQEAVAAAQWALNAAMDANPIGVVVMAVAALVAGLIYAYKHSETFRNIVNTAFRGVADAAIWVWDHLKQFWSWLSGVFQPVGQAIASAWSTAWGLVQSVVSTAAAILHKVFQVIWMAMLPIRIEVAVLAAVFKIAWALIVDVIKIAWGVIKGIFDLYVQYVVGPLARGLLYLVGVARQVWDDFTRVISKAWGFIRPILLAIVSQGIGFVKWEMQTFQKAWNAAWGVVSGVVQGVWSVIKPILDRIGGAIDFVSSKASGLISSIGSVGNNVSGFLSHIPGLAGGTDNWGGGVTWVGENGPELVWLPPHTAVTPNRESMRVGGLNGGGATPAAGGYGGLPQVAYATIVTQIDGETVRVHNQKAQLQYYKRNGITGQVPQ